MVDDTQSAYVLYEGHVTVSGVEDGATWEYSLDGGTAWKATDGTTVALADIDSYGSTTAEDIMTTICQAIDVLRSSLASSQ